MCTCIGKNCVGDRCSIEHRAMTKGPRHVDCAMSSAQWLELQNFSFWLEFGAACEQPICVSASTVLATTCQVATGSPWVPRSTHRTASVADTTLASSMQLTEPALYEAMNRGLIARVHGRLCVINTSYPPFDQCSGENGAYRASHAFSCCLHSIF